MGGIIVPLIGVVMFLFSQFFPVGPKVIALELVLFLAISYTINHNKGSFSKSVAAVKTYFFPEKMPEKKVDIINWSRKMRVFVGGVGSRIIEGGKGGHLAEMVSTPAFRDALL